MSIPSSSANGLSTEYIKEYMSSLMHQEGTRTLDTKASNRPAPLTLAVRQVYGVGHTRVVTATILTDGTTSMVVGEWEGM